MELKQTPIDSIKEYSNNARTHSESQIAEIMDSVKAFGFLDPIEIDTEGTVISGHARLEAARRLGFLEIPTITHAGLDKNAVKGYILAANRIAQNAGWDFDILQKEFTELMEHNFDMHLTGFSESEIDKILNPEGIKEGLTDPDDTPLTNKANIISQLGDIWVLGDNRLACGDSMDMSIVEKLMDYAKADLIFTDPSYGMSYGGGRSKTHKMIKNDDLGGDDLIQLVQGALSNAFLHASEKCAAYVCFTWHTYAEFVNALKLCSKEITACIVWNKKSIGLGMQHYRPQHEFIFYCAGDIWNGEKNKSDVWEVGRDSAQGYVHPTQKPVELIEHAILNSSNVGSRVIDVFGGSGSTLIACERTRRKSYTIELDPIYCDVIIKRWQNHTGRKAYLESTGETFSGL